jgi:hypothetical protein
MSQDGGATLGIIPGNFFLFPDGDRMRKSPRSYSVRALCVIE